MEISIQKADSHDLLSMMNEDRRYFVCKYFWISIFWGVCQRSVNSKQDGVLFFLGIHLFDRNENKAVLDGSTVPAIIKTVSLSFTVLFSSVSFYTMSTPWRSITKNKSSVQKRYSWHLFSKYLIKNSQMKDLKSRKTIDWPFRLGQMTTTLKSKDYLLSLMSFQNLLYIHSPKGLIGTPYPISPSELP